MTKKDSNLYLNWFKFQSINTEVSLVPFFHQWNFLVGLNFHKKFSPIPCRLPSVDCFFVFCGAALFPPCWVSNTKLEPSNAIRTTFFNDLGFAFVELISWLRQLMGVFNTLLMGWATHNNIFELFCRYRTPHQVGEVNKMLPTNTEPPDLLEAEGGWNWLLFTSPPINQRTSTNWHAPSELWL